jgi:hypothetical protein
MTPPVQACNFFLQLLTFNKSRLTNMRPTILPVFVLLLVSCQSLHSSDPHSLLFSIPEGSILSLNNELTIPAYDTHAVVQDGKEIADKDRNDYAINCRLDFKKFGPRNIEPQDFIITRTEDGKNWISHPAILRFYTEVYLASEKGTDIIKMVCQQYGDTIDRNFTVAEMQTALGDFISITFK